PLPPLNLLSLHSPFFSSLPSSPPCSTLFPYTTLFRSRLHRDRLRLPQPPPQQALDDSRPQAPARRRGSEEDGGEGRRGDRELSSDRKSTRLNPSHVSISYAVFCLKKKKKHTL